jgi:hypothetical protein
VQLEVGVAARAARPLLPRWGSPLRALRWIALGPPPSPPVLQTASEGPAFPRARSGANDSTPVVSRFVVGLKWLYANPQSLSKRSGTCPGKKGGFGDTPSSTAPRGVCRRPLGDDSRVVGSFPKRRSCMPRQPSPMQDDEAIRTRLAPATPVGTSTSAGRATAATLIAAGSNRIGPQGVRKALRRDH